MSSGLRLPMDDENYRANMQELVEAVMDGFVYHGTRVETIIDTVVAMRAHPELATKVLA